MNAMLYVLTVLIWGTTWIALKWQLGPASIPVSIAWRFLLASLILFGILWFRRQLSRPRGEAMWLILAQGLCLFCLNFLCFYHASQWIPSGLVSVVFSTSTLWVALNARIFMNRPLSPQVLGGGALGMAGIVALFWPQLSVPLAGTNTLLGLMLALVGTLCFSAGNLLSSRLQTLGHTPLQTNAWAMMVGTIILLVGSVATGQDFAIDTSPRYVAALLYLAIPGSVIGFTAYLMLVGRIGPERAAYSTVLFPVVALNISVLFEGYQWTSVALLGLMLVMAGNIMVFRKPKSKAAIANEATDQATARSP